MRKLLRINPALTIDVTDIKKISVEPGSESKYSVVVYYRDPVTGETNRAFYGKKLFCYGEKYARRLAKELYKECCVK